MFKRKDYSTPCFNTKMRYYKSMNNAIREKFHHQNNCVMRAKFKTVTFAEEAMMDHAKHKQ